MPIFLVLMGISGVSGLFGMEDSQSPKANLGTIEICSVDNMGYMTCVKRTAWIPEGREGQSFCCNATSDGKVMEPAPEAIYKEATIIQEKLGLNQMPAFVYPSQSTVGEINVRPNGAYVFLREDLLTEENTGIRQFVEGHEAGHALGGTSERFLARNRYYRLKKVAEISASIGTIAAVGSVLIPKRMPVVKPMCRTTGGTFLGVYGIARIASEYCKEILHNEEFGCDRVPVEKLADTPEEKIAMAKNGIVFFNLYPEDHSLKARIYRAFFPSTHPSDKRRINQLKNMIYEQEDILKSKSKG